MTEKIAVGMASGLGNCIYMLPAIKALYLMGHDIALYVETDFATADLWRRCAYASAVFEKPANLNGRMMIAGEYQPASWATIRIFARALLKRPYDCVWDSNMRLARAFGFCEEAPDVSDWCLNLRREKLWDVGIVPGCKGGIWLRKRWPQMKSVARDLRRLGYSVAVFGLAGDDVDQIPGEHVQTEGLLAQLPEMLASCSVIVSTDSGVGHLASSLGLPVVMVYTATSEQKADPVGFRKAKIIPRIDCHPCVSTPQWHYCTDWKCQRRINQAEVIDAAVGFLNGSL